MGINGAAYASYTAPGRAAPTSASPARGHDLDARRRAAGHRPGAPARAAATSARGSACRPRATASWPGARADDSVYAPPRHRPQPVERPAGALGARHRRAAGAAAPTRPTSTSRTTARSPGPSFRQDIAGGSRALARRMLGSTFDPPVLLDGGPGSTAPRVGDERPRPGARRRSRRRAAAWRATCSTSTPSGRASCCTRRRRRRAPSPSPPPPSIARTCSPGGSPTAAATRRSRAACSRSRPSPSTPRSSSRGPTSARCRPASSRWPADRLAGFVVAMAQGPPGSRAITVALHDRPPGPAGRDRAQRLAERAAGEARVAPGRRPVGPAALPRRRRRQGRRRDDRQLAACPPSA